MSKIESKSSLELKEICQQAVAAGLIKKYPVQMTDFEIVALLIEIERNQYMRHCMHSLVNITERIDDVSAILGDQ
jgi:hypothetical protein